MTMDERSILTAHIQALAQELELAEENLGLPRVEKDLRERVSGLCERMRLRFGQLIGEQQRTLKIVQEEVDSDMPLDMCWDSFQNVRKDCQPILSECFALTQGAVARGAGLDDRLCEIADFLLDGLSSLALSGMNVVWGRFTILAEGEFYGTMAAVIRLRYPEVSVWNLPVAAHEFGHFVAEKTEEPQDSGKFKDYFVEYHDLLPQVTEYHDLLSQMSEKEARETQKAQEQKRLMFLHEYYADIFATYVLGPAYAYTCLLLRFDPRTAYKDWSQHPSAQKRAHAILKTLEEMNKVKDSKEDYIGLIKNLRTWWKKSIEQAHPCCEQPAPYETLWRLEELVETLHDRMGTRMPYVRYGGWPRVSRLHERMKDQQPAQALKPENKLRDVLNAVWLRRINVPDGCQRANNDVLDNQARTLCERIVNRPPRNPKATV
jgi:hypothetical protein